MRSFKDYYGNTLEEARKNIESVSEDIWKKYPDNDFIGQLDEIVRMLDEIKANMDDFMNRRKTKQPLEYPSAGSVFKRPQGNFAGTLIEKCGLKGKTIGGAQVSEKHAGFIINVGGATCEDVLNLVKFVQDTVMNETGYFLEREIIHID